MPEGFFIVSTHFIVGGSLNLLVLITAHKKAGQQLQTSSRTNIQFLVFHLTLADTIVSLGLSNSITSYPM